MADSAYDERCEKSQMIRRALARMSDEQGSSVKVLSVYVSPNGKVVLKLLADESEMMELAQAE